MIVLIFKKGDKANIAVYRPVALLTTVSKVFEIVLYDILYDQFKYVNNRCQYGFTRGRGAILQLLDYLDEVYKARDDSEGSFLVCVYEDSEKTLTRCAMALYCENFGLVMCAQLYTR